MLRRLAALAVLALGAWLGYEAAHAALVIMGRGSDLASALLDPPTSIIRLVATALMVIGGALAALRIKGGGITCLVGALLFTALGGLMAGSGADQGLWLDEVLYGVGAIGLSILILTLHRE